MVEAMRERRGAIAFEAMAVVGMYLTVGQNIPYEALEGGKAERYIRDADVQTDKLLERRSMSPLEKREYIDLMTKYYESRYVPGVCASPELFRERLSLVLEAVSEEQALAA